MSNLDSPISYYTTNLFLPQFFSGDIRTLSALCKIVVGKYFWDFVWLDRKEMRGTKQQGTFQEFLVWNILHNGNMERNILSLKCSLGENLVTITWPYLTHIYGDMIIKSSDQFMESNPTPRFPEFYWDLSQPQSNLITKSLKVRWVGLLSLLTDKWLNCLSFWFIYN